MPEASCFPEEVKPWSMMMVAWWSSGVAGWRIKGGGKLFGPGVRRVRRGDHGASGEPSSFLRLELLTPSSFLRLLPSGVLSIAGWLRESFSRPVMAARSGVGHSSTVGVGRSSSRAAGRFDCHSPDIWTGALSEQHTRGPRRGWDKFDL